MARRVLGKEFQAEKFSAFFPTFFPAKKVFEPLYQFIGEKSLELHEHLLDLEVKGKKARAYIQETNVEELPGFINSLLTGFIAAMEDKASKDEDVLDVGFPFLNGMITHLIKKPEEGEDVNVDSKPVTKPNEAKAKTLTEQQTITFNEALERTAKIMFPSKEKISYGERKAALRVVLSTIAKALHYAPESVKSLQDETEVSIKGDVTKLWRDSSNNHQDILTLAEKSCFLTFGAVLSGVGDDVVAKATGRDAEGKIQLDGALQEGTPQKDLFMKSFGEFVKYSPAQIKAWGEGKLGISAVANEPKKQVQAVDETIDIVNDDSDADDLKEGNEVVSKGDDVERIARPNSARERLTTNSAAQNAAEIGKAEGWGTIPAGLARYNKEKGRVRPSTVPHVADAPIVKLAEATLEAGARSNN